MRIAPPALGGRLRACHSRRRRVPDLKARPMLLAIDAGNTNVVFALVKDREIRARWRIATDPRRTADEYAVWLHQLLALEGYDSTDIADVIVATVVPKALHNLEVLASKYFGANAHNRSGSGRARVVQ